MFWVCHAKCHAHMQKNVLCANGSIFRRELTKCHESKALRNFLGMSRKQLSHMKKKVLCACGKYF